MNDTLGEGKAEGRRMNDEVRRRKGVPNAEHAGTRFVGGGGREASAMTNPVCLGVEFSGSF
jgi:hypothetical protein